MKALVLADTDEQVAALNAMLWSYDPNSFLPHGSAKDGDEGLQPIFLTSQQDNPNHADVLVLVDGGEHSVLAGFTRCLDMFNGNDETAVSRARERWVAYRDAGHKVTYWQQNDAGRWEEKG